jgi:hypothetical protein
MKMHRVLAKKNPDPQRKMPRLIGIFAALVILAIAPVLSEGRTQQAPPGPPSPPPNPPGVTPHQVYPTPDAKGMTDGDEVQPPHQNDEMAAALQKRELVADAGKLLMMAADLKAEVDKSSKDVLSVDVIRKAEAIEKLAHHLRGELKVTVGAH